MIKTQQQHPYFQLFITQHKSHTNIKMALSIATVNTQDLPHTYKMLEKLLPSILKSTCYNNKKLPFFKEVQQTELGHLFEHILLEYLCMLKIKKGHKRATYRGYTSWNWLKDPRGTFHITANSGFEDADILAEAMKQTIDLMHLVMRKEEEKEELQTYKQATSVPPVYMMVS